MNIASCGLGTNSIAGIIHAINNGYVFDEILFANTGRGRKFGEREATYDYIKIFNNWLKNKGHKRVKIVYSKNSAGKSISLYEEMIKNETLPPIVFGFKTCSQRFKAAPQEKYLNSNTEAKKVWANGEKIAKWIFYDAGEPHRAKEYEDDKYIVRYYLIENDFDREDCINIIIEANLPLPAKSSCFYCPSMKPEEVIELYIKEPSKFYQAVDMERIAANGGKMVAISGLGRDFSWWNLIKAYRYMAWVKKSTQADLIIEKSMAKLMKKINRAYRRPPKRKKDKKIIETAKEVVCSLFPANQEFPCGCYDG